MIKKKGAYFGNNISPNCDYCQNGSDYDGASVCVLGQFISHDGKCRKFIYDPLKRQPKALPPLKSHDPEEFSL